MSSNNPNYFLIILKMYLSICCLFEESVVKICKIFLIICILLFIIIVIFFNNWLTIFDRFLLLDKMLGVF